MFTPEEISIKTDELLDDPFDKVMYIIIDAMLLDDNDPNSSRSIGRLIVAHTPNDPNYNYSGIFVMDEWCSVIDGLYDPHMNELEAFDVLAYKLIMSCQADLAKHYSIDVSKCTNFHHDICKAFRTNSYHIIKFPEGVIE